MTTVDAILLPNNWRDISELRGDILNLIEDFDVEEIKLTEKDGEYWTEGVFNLHAITSREEGQLGPDEWYDHDDS